jgi:Bifunctional DNA primase/polymerase, N-terminal
MSCLGAALTFAELGCRVVPPRGKHPGGYLGHGWQRQATRDPEVIRRWYARWPEANVGILGDRTLLPLDVDDPASFQHLQAETVAAPDTPRF